MLIDKNLAIQDTYGERFQHCWGCGPKNPDGIHLKSYPSEDGEVVQVTYKPDDIYTGGVPKNLFGGMIAVIFDCHGTASAAFFAHKAKGLDYTKDTVIGRFITARLEIDFKKPTPMDTDLIVRSTVEEITERKVIVKMVLEAKGEVRAEARMVAVGVKDNM